MDISCPRAVALILNVAPDTNSNYGAVWGCHVWRLGVRGARVANVMAWRVVRGVGGLVCAGGAWLRA